MAPPVHPTIERRNASGPEATIPADEICVQNPKHLDRYVVAGTRSHMACTQDGLCPPMGWHIKGEMGGVWINGERSQVKVADGHRLSIDGKRLSNPHTFATGLGYARFDYGPVARGLEAKRVDFAPDGVPGVASIYTFRNTEETDRTITIDLDVAIDILAPYPWEGRTESRDRIAFDDEIGAFVASDTLRTKGLDRKRSATMQGFAVVGASERPVGISLDATSHRPAMTIDRRDAGSVVTMTYTFVVPKNGTRQFTVVAAGSDRHRSDAAEAFVLLRDRADALLAEKQKRLKAYTSATQLSSPSPELDRAFRWSKANLAMDESIVPAIGRGVAAGYPDYPWFFANDGAYTIYPLLATGRSDLARDHLRLIARASRKRNGLSGKIIHEVVGNGTVYFGTNDDPGNANETAQFIMALAETFRWTGDRAFLRELYPDARRGAMSYLTGSADADGDLFPEGNGMVERNGMGAEKLDVAVYTWRALMDLVEMADAMGDKTTATKAAEKTSQLQENIRTAWWIDREGCFADSLGENNEPRFQRFWTIATPFEVGVASFAQADRCLPLLTGPAFSHRGALYHNRASDGIDEDLRLWTLPAGTLAVGLAHYGRPAEALRSMNAIAALVDHEMPGALDEIIPRGIKEAPLTERSDVQQAWSTYGIVWPTVSGFAGIRPDIPHETISIIPNPPPSWKTFSLSDIAIGGNTYDIDYTRRAKGISVTVVPKSNRGDMRIVVGGVIPATAVVQSVQIDGTTIPASDWIIEPVGEFKRISTSASASGPIRFVISLR